MAGDWIKMRTSLQRDPRVIKIASALNADRLRVIGGLHAAWSLADEQTEDGFLDGYSFAVIDQMVGWDGFCSALEAVDWAHEDRGGVSFPRFVKHNGQSAKRRAQEADRKRSARASASDADKKRTREEKRRDIKSIVGNPDKSRSDAASVLAYLNAQAGREYKPVNGNISLIAARLKEGASIEDCKAVVDRKVNEWRGGEMDKYLRPATLFNATKFAQYQGETPRKPVGEVI